MCVGVCDFSLIFSLCVCVCVCVNISNLLRRYGRWRQCACVTRTNTMAIGGHKILMDEAQCLQWLDSMELMTFVSFGGLGVHYTSTDY
jgi:hypothetical protein